MKFDVSVNVTGFYKIELEVEADNKQEVEKLLEEFDPVSDKSDDDIKVIRRYFDGEDTYTDIVKKDK